jgi:hypothetical protein
MKVHPARTVKVVPDLVLTVMAVLDLMEMVVLAPTEAHRLLSPTVTAVVTAPVLTEVSLRLCLTAVSRLQSPVSNSV